MASSCWPSCCSRTKRSRSERILRRSTASSQSRAYRARSTTISSSARIVSTSFYATSGATGSVLTNFDLIWGLRALVESFDPAATSFTGEILLGGAGSDIIKGGWGDEIIDADAWLNVQIAIYGTFDPTHSGSPLEVFNSMAEFQDEIFKRETTIGQLGIVREIRHTLLDPDEETTTKDDYDTVSFDGNRGEYVIENLVMDNNGTPGESSTTTSRASCGDPSRERRRRRRRRRCRAQRGAAGVRGSERRPRTQQGQQGASGSPRDRQRLAD